jgi:uncharacterized membrane protein YciS (DUF1049 family)
MGTLIRLIIAIPVVVVVVALALVNNQPVTVSFDPFSPAEPLFSATVPLYVVFFAALAIGVLVGGLAVWFGQHRYRAAARANRREASRWRDEAERLRGGVDDPQAGKNLRLVDGGNRAA